jgi:hypothetical protein
MEFDNDHLLTGLAFWEWVLCLNCVMGLWALAGAVEKMELSESLRPSGTQARP